MTELALHTSSGKPQMGDLDPMVLLEAGQVMTNGLAKYPNDDDGMPNWYKGGSYRDFCASMLRHVLAIAAGHDMDDGPKGDGLSHAAHLICDAAFLRSWQLRNVGRDDRLSYGPDRLTDAKLQVALVGGTV